MFTLVVSTLCSRDLDADKSIWRKTLEAFKMWIWRRMTKISWEDKISNDKVC